jgi:hypothetical protein
MSVVKREVDESEIVPPYSPVFYSSHEDQEYLG